MCLTLDKLGTFTPALKSIKKTFPGVFLSLHLLLNTKLPDIWDSRLFPFIKVTALNPYQVLGMSLQYFPGTGDIKRKKKMIPLLTY